MSTARNTTGYQAFKAGGTVMKADGGAMGTLSDMAAMKMAQKRAAKKPMGGRPMPAVAMKKGGYAEGGETKKTHMAEMSKMKGLEKDLQSHKSKSASMGHKGLKAGGKAMYKDGGTVAKAARAMSGNAMPMPTLAVAKPTKNTLNKGPASKVSTAAGTKSYPNTGKGIEKKVGGYKAGGPVEGAEKMPQGKKAPSAPVRISQLAGTFKKGGMVDC